MQQNVAKIILSQCFTPAACDEEITHWIFPLVDSSRDVVALKKSSERQHPGDVVELPMRSKSPRNKYPWNIINQQGSAGIFGYSIHKTFQCVITEDLDCHEISLSWNVIDKTSSRIRR